MRYQTLQAAWDHVKPDFDPETLAEFREAFMLGAGVVLELMATSDPESPEHTSEKVIAMMREFQAYADAMPEDDG